MKLRRLQNYTFHPVHCSHLVSSSSEETEGTATHKETE